MSRRISRAQLKGDSHCALVLTPLLTPIHLLITGEQQGLGRHRQAGVGSAGSDEKDKVEAGSTRNGSTQRQEQIGREDRRCVPNPTDGAAAATVRRQVPSSYRRVFENPLLASMSTLRF